MMFNYKIVFILLSVALLVSCAQVPRDGEFSEVERLVGERIPQRVHWYQGGEEDAQVRAFLDDLLKQPLTAQSAVQIALLNNRRLQSEYEELGIAQADLVQAGLLSNPVLFSSIRFPKGGDGGNNVEFDLSKDFLDILFRPARQRLAEKEFTRTRLRVVNVVLDLAAEVQSAFYNVQGKRQLVEVLKLSEDAAQVSYRLARRFDEAGNLSERALAQERSAAAEMTAELMRANARLQYSRDQLNGLLGLTGTRREWTVAHELPELPVIDPDPELSVQSAIENRPDLEGSLREMEQLADALELTRNYRWIGGASVGVSTERDPDGSHVTGPNFSVELPIFDQRQADIARLESQLAQSKSRHQALETAIRNEVRTAVNNMNAARILTEYFRDELVPAREQVLRFTQQEQNYMLVDVFELLYARQQVTQAYRGYIEALAEYWISRAELARVTGTGLPKETLSTTTSADDHNNETTGKGPAREDDGHSVHDDTRH